MDKHMLSPESKKDTALTNKRQIERGVVSKAIYMVTEILDQSEPLRMALRNAAVTLLKDDSRECIATLKRLLILSSEVGIISHDNIQILLKAIDNMKTLVVTQEEKTVNLDGFFEQMEDGTDTTNDHSVSSESVVADDAKKIEDVYVQKNISTDNTIKPHTSPVVQNATYTSVVRSSAATLREDIQRQLEKANQKSSTPLAVTTLDIGTRRKKILEVVKSKGQVTIHEFIQSIQGCSSKTIQRELTSLVLSGTLKKTGERRWSKYSLR